MYKYLINLVPLVISILLLGSCSVVRFAKIYSSDDLSGGKGELRGSVYTSGDTSYRIGILSDDWQRVSTDRGDIFFWNSAKKASITVNSVCDSNKLKYNLNALSESLVTGIRDKEMIKRDEIEIDGTDALYSEYEGIYDDRHIGIATIVLKKDKCVYDLSYSTLADSFNSHLEEYLEFSADFEVKGQP